MIEEESLLYKEDHIQAEAKDTFYDYLKKYGIDLDEIDPNEKLPIFIMKVIKAEPVEYNKFNNVIYKLNKNNEVNIVDSAVYLVEDWIEPQVLMKCFDELNQYMLINALRNKHNINRLLGSGLNDIFK